MRETELSQTTNKKLKRNFKYTRESPIL